MFGVKFIHSSLPIIPQIVDKKIDIICDWGKWGMENMNRVNTDNISSPM